MIGKLPPEDYVEFLIASALLIVLTLVGSAVVGLAVRMFWFVAFGNWSVR